MSGTLGTLVVNERVLRIAHIGLRAGQIEFHTVPVPGPIDLPARSEVRVHAPDGSLIATAPWTLDESYRRQVARCRGGMVTIVFPMAFRSVEGWPAAMAPHPNG